MTQNSDTRLDHRQAKPSLATVSRPKTVRIHPKADPNELEVQGSVSVHLAATQPRIRP